MRIQPENAAKNNRAEEKTHQKENRNGEKQCDAKTANEMIRKIKESLRKLSVKIKFVFRNGEKQGDTKKSFPRNYKKRERKACF